MEVSVNPDAANAFAAPRRIEVRRSARGSSLLSVCIRVSIYRGVTAGMTREGAAMATAQVEFTEEELLADLMVAEPLIAGGVRCHGGFDDDGRYLSPRTKFRLPAIAAWGEQNSERFSSELI